MIEVWEFSNFAPPAWKLHNPYCHIVKTKETDPIESCIKIGSALWNLDDYKGSELKYATTEEDRNKLWKARHDMHWAIRNYKPGYIYHGTDICVPISKLPEAIEYCQKLFQILGVEGKLLKVLIHLLMLNAFLNKIPIRISPEFSKNSDDICFSGWKMIYFSV